MLRTVAVPPMAMTHVEGLPGRTGSGGCDTDREMLEPGGSRAEQGRRPEPVDAGSGARRGEGRARRGQVLSQLSRARVEGDQVRDLPRTAERVRGGCLSKGHSGCLAVGGSHAGTHVVESGGTRRVCGEPGLDDRRGS